MKPLRAKGTALLAGVCLLCLASGFQQAYLAPGRVLPTARSHQRSGRSSVLMQAAVVSRRGPGSSSPHKGFMKQLVEADRTRRGPSSTLASLLSFQQQEEARQRQHMSSPPPPMSAPIGVENYRHVMALAEDEGRWERILELFRGMLAAHIEPDQDIHDRVARAALAIKAAPPEAQPLAIPPYPQPWRSVPVAEASVIIPPLPPVTLPLKTPKAKASRPPTQVVEKKHEQAATQAEAKYPSARLTEALRDVLLRPSEATYSAAIEACVEEQGGKQWETALKMYEEALYKGIDLHMHAKSNVLRACKQGCQLKYAEVLFHEMASPGVRDYCAMLTLYRTFNRWRDAEHIYHKMVTHIAQEPLYDGPVSSLWQGQDVPKTIPPADGDRGHQPLEVTLAIMQYMVDCPRSGVSPDKLTFLAAMEVATSQGRWDMCIFLYEKSREMLEDGSLELSWALVQSLESLGQAKLADHMYELAYRRGLINHWSRWLDRVDLHHFSQLVARVAVRQVFNEFLGGPGEALPLHLDRPEKGLIIVTGAGKRSENGLPVLRPCILKMLRHEFSPSLKGAHVCKDNKGRIIVPWSGIEKWIDGQQRAVRLLRRSQRKPAGKLRALITY